MMKMDQSYDVAIIGSGIAGSTLGAILARQGLKVLIFEAKSHPRFAIGESMILETSETMRALAELYDVPELAYFSSENYFLHIGTSHGVKRHFSYLYHRPDQPQVLSEALQAIIPRQPHGHELHLYRQDTDYFMMSTAIAYGVEVLQNTPVQNVDIQADGVNIHTQKGDLYHAKYIVDAGGYRSILAQKYDLRDHNLRTHSRAIFTHMVNVPCYHEATYSKDAYDLPFRVSEGTLHHVFEGGWLWVIPFNNHSQATNPLCSVGLMLDPRHYPLDESLTPEAEFFTFIERFPDIKAQFQEARSVRPWTRTGRIQYSSKRVVGDRFALLGHAAGFIDPLFSKGLYSSLSSVSLLANLLLEAHEDGDYSAQRFQPLEKLTKAFIDNNDALIANAYKCFGNYQLWSAYTVLWLLGAYTELVKLLSIRLQAKDRAAYYAEAQDLCLVGGGFTEFSEIAQKIDALISEVDLADQTQITQTREAMEAILTQVDWIPEPFKAILSGKTYLPTNKIRPSLFRKDQGFLGKGSYREHFFRDGGQTLLIKAFVQEKLKYSVPSLKLKRRVYYAR